MAATDIYSTQERIRHLEEAKKAIISSIRRAKEAESLFGTYQKNTYDNDYNEMWLRVQQIISYSEADALLAISLLEALTGNTGFDFQYKWTIGKGGITQFAFSGATIQLSTALVSNESVFTNGTTVVLSQYDRILIEGTTSNDGVFAIDTGSTATALVPTVSMTSETCTTVGASITLLRRGN